MYVQEAGEGTSPILSVLYPFLMINKLSAEIDIGYNKQQERHRIVLTYMLIYFFGSLPHQYINTSSHNNIELA